MRVLFIVILAISLLGVPACSQRKPSTTTTFHEAQFSAEEEKEFQAIVTFGKETNLNWTVDDPSGKTPGFQQIGLQFLYTTNLDVFLERFGRWQKLELKKGLRQKRQEAIERLNVNRNEKQPLSFDGYIEHLSDVLSLGEIEAELEEFDNAERLAQYALKLAAPERTTYSPEQEVILRHLLNSEALWRAGNILGKTSLMLGGLQADHQLVGALTNNIEMRHEIQKRIADRCFRLAKNGINRETNAREAVTALRSVVQGDRMDIDAWLNFIFCCHWTGDHDGVLEGIPGLIKAVRRDNSGRKLDTTLQELVRMQTIAQYRTLDAFKERFGPFAALIWAECTGTPSGEAWKQAYGRQFRSANTNIVELEKRAVLIGTTVIIEGSKEAYVERVVHEVRHAMRNAGTTWKSGDRWHSVARDVPTAALETYHTLLRGSDSALKEALRDYLELGREWASPENGKLDEWIKNMLGYFSGHGVETNSAYGCAAILLGVMEELFESLESEEARIYVAHLFIMDHRSALKAARERVRISF